MRPCSCGGNRLHTNESETGKSMTTTSSNTTTRTGPASPDPQGRSFIETQFPVSKLSKESYKERKAVAGQTLTGLGKWWGRKPLVLVRALILGLLLPASDDPEADRETFLALMTMDDEGLLRRQNKSIPAKTVYDYATRTEREQYFTLTAGKAGWQRGVDRDDRAAMQRRAFLRMNYDDKLAYCDRPEQIDGPDPDAWRRINAHLGTSASNLPELVEELGQRRWGHTPRVGDAFCGGGSIPFEAARIGCEAYGSDLNPVAALLTWGALNIVGGGQEAVDRVSAAQRRVYDAVQRQVNEWGIERNARGWIADAYLYCNEVVDPASGWTVPLAPSWVIATKTNVIARLVPDTANRRFDVEIVENVSASEMRQAADEGTAADGVRSPVDRSGVWLPLSQRQSTSARQLRGRDGLRLWENEDVVPRPGDVYQERLYCVRWLDPVTGERHYRAPDSADLERERRVLALLEERFAEWQALGYIPSRQIEPGDKTDEPIRTRGWTHWHHLFNPRQLLLHGLFAQFSTTEPEFEQRALLLMMGRLADWNSRLSRWNVQKSGGNGGGEQTFYNQAFNTLANFSCRPIAMLSSTFIPDLKVFELFGSGKAQLVDAREIEYIADAWITDPGYADAINYDEVSEHFLAWYSSRIVKLLPGWYTDSKRALTVRGNGADFRQSLAQCYQRLNTQSHDDAFHVVMFTHQDPKVWADVALVLWSAGLRIVNAWTIATERASAGLRSGNYVQGTACLILRKRSGHVHAELGDLFPEIQREVEMQLDSMLALDDKEDPNFGDADYQLAAYAAALRVLTGYSSIGSIDVERELRRTGTEAKANPLTGLIERAVTIASDALVPSGIERSIWRRMTPEERFYLKGIDVESQGEHREGVFQELARSYGVVDYRVLLASSKANATRLKTPTEMAGRDLRTAGSDGFTGSLLRQVLFATYQTATDPERDPRRARQHLRQELPDYWGSRQTMIELLGYLATKGAALEHWYTDAHAARLLLGSIENDSM